MAARHSRRLYLFTEYAGRNFAPSVDIEARLSSGIGNANRKAVPLTACPLDFVIGDCQP